MKPEVIVLAIVLVALVLGIFFRYDLQIVSSGGQGNAAMGFLLNRWTGTIYFVYPQGTRELQPIPENK